MPPYGSLAGGKPRLLARHDGAEGWAYHRAFLALAAQFGPFATELVRYEAGRTAMAWVQYQTATRALGAAQRARRVGKGRRPNPQQIERLARRQGLADKSYTQALDKFRELATRNGIGQDLASRLAQLPDAGQEPDA